MYELSLWTLCKVQLGWAYRFACLRLPPYPVLDSQLRQYLNNSRPQATIIVKYYTTMASMNPSKHSFAEFKLLPSMPSQVAFPPTSPYCKAVSVAVRIYTGTIIPHRRWSGAASVGAPHACVLILLLISRVLITVPPRDRQRKLFKVATQDGKRPTRPNHIPSRCHCRELMTMYIRRDKALLVVSGPI